MTKAPTNKFQYKWVHWHWGGNNEFLIWNAQEQTAVMCQWINFPSDATVCGKFISGYTCYMGRYWHSVAIFQLVTSLEYRDMPLRPQQMRLDKTQDVGYSDQDGSCISRLRCQGWDSVPSVVQDVSVVTVSLHFIFQMLDDKGNTAVYLQYAYMRIRLVSVLHLHLHPLLHTSIRWLHLDFKKGFIVTRKKCITSDKFLKITLMYL